ncbi:MAG: FAD-dependent oxidoreductase [Deltaproteobacteria bacterium]|nr:FAD-dependent oxidoreductase [Deltaproteobacteria bacterium]
MSKLFIHKSLNLHKTGKLKTNTRIWVQYASMEKLTSDVTVIGAGVIGLAIACRLGGSDKSVTVVESYPKFGNETSSRNSEVIHSGIHYPIHSLKTRYCIEGREKLYQFCEQYGVGYRQTGKFVVACSDTEVSYLENLSQHCKSLGVPHDWVTGGAIETAEKLVAARGGLFLPRTGIVDSHSLMATLERKAIDGGVVFAYRHRVKSVTRAGNAWDVVVESPTDNFQISSAVVINAAGLGAAEITNQALGRTRYQHKYCRGRYFMLSSKYRGRFSHLVYPVPQKDGLGVHVTVDMEQNARLGPDTDWSDIHHYAEVSRLYDCDWSSLTEPFLKSVNRYCPSIKRADLTPGLIGIRPKLFVDGTAHPDFLLENTDNFIHCLGIESPGLTSCLVIADEVEKLL